MGIELGPATREIEHVNHLLAFRINEGDFNVRAQLSFFFLFSAYGVFLLTGSSGSGVELPHIRRAPLASL